MKLQSSKNGSNFVCGKGTFSQIRSHMQFGDTTSINIHRDGAYKLTQYCITVFDDSSFLNSSRGSLCALTVFSWTAENVDVHVTYLKELLNLACKYGLKSNLSPMKLCMDEVIQYLVIMLYEDRQNGFTNRLNKLS